MPCLLIESKNNTVKHPGHLVNEMYSACDIANFSYGSPCIRCHSIVSSFENDNQLGLDDMVFCLEQTRQSITAKDGASFV
jgi:hypothetical protein